MADSEDTIRALHRKLDDINTKVAGIKREIDGFWAVVSIVAVIYLGDIVLKSLMK